MKGFFKKQFFFFISSVSLTTCAAIQQWDWSTINVNNIVLPNICGTAIAEYQYSGEVGCPHSNWAHWEAKEFHNGRRTIANGDRSGIACNGRNLWRDDIKLIQDLGCNSFRFSVEWSNIEPQEGEFNQEALNYYIERCEALLKVGIEPMITLLHFTTPQWFEELGGFEKEENIHYFVRFCEYVFAALSDKVKLWCTINEIGATAFEGYIHGTHPPGYRMALLRWAKYVRSMCSAHCQVYKALKAMPNGKDAQIGLVHAYLTFEPHSYSSELIPRVLLPGVAAYGIFEGLRSLLSFDKDLSAHRKSRMLGAGVTLGALCGLLTFQRTALEGIPSRFMTYMFNGAMLNFLKTGTLFSPMPGLRMTISDAPECYDFIGINCYSRVVLKSRIADKLVSGGDMVVPAGRDGEIMTDMQFAICPEALYGAIVEISQLRDTGVPIYITENGIADSDDDRRALWIKRYLYAVSKAIRDGYDVRGYYYWSLMDNFEWNEGLYEKRFGLYAVDFESQERTRTLRKSSELYRDALLTAERVSNT